jgi:hypothetical protein
MRVQQIYLIKCRLLYLIFMTESQMKEFFYSPEIGILVSLQVVTSAENTSIHSTSTRL